MNITAKESKLRTIKPGDPDFRIYDGLIVATRAGFKISNECPSADKALIMRSINNGWLKPVATIYDHELVWERLSTE